MYLIEKIANEMVSHITSTLDLDKDKKEVLIYGAVNFLQMLWTIMLTALLGFTFDVLATTLIVSFASAILRKSSGGAHVPSPNRCAIIGAVSSTAIALFAGWISRYVILCVPIIIFSFLYSYHVIYRLAPVDSPAKPIKKDSTRKRLKKQAVKTLHVYLMIDGVFMFIFHIQGHAMLMTYSSAIALGTMWQSISLTSSGHTIINFMDALLVNITSLVRREKNEK